MRIRGWSIDAFGVLRDYAIENLPAGLVVFHRPNEAGKSTLLAFLRGVLFGFPTNGNGYGAAARGRLFLVGEDGEYAVERRADETIRVRCPDGREGASAELHALLEGIDESVFRSVFAFGLGELQAFETLGAAVLRERFFSATLVGAGRAATSVIAELERGADGLFGGDARIQALVDALNDMRPRRDAARRAALSYERTAGEERRLAAEITALRRRSADLRAERKRLELLAQLWPQWSELGEMEATLAALDPAMRMPAGLPAALRASDDRMAATRAVLAALEREQVEAAARHAAIQQNCPAGEDHDAASRPDAALQRARLDRRAQLARQRAELARALESRLVILGPAWTAERVAHAGAAPASRSALRELELARRDLERESERIRAATTLAASRCATLLRERESLAVEVGDPESDLAALVAQSESLRRLEENMALAESDRTRGEAADATAKDRERALASVETRDAPMLPSWLVPILALVATCAAAAAASQLWGGDSAIAAAFAFTAGITGLGLLAAGRFRAEIRRDEVRRQTECRALQSELGEARRRREAHWRRSAERRDEVARDALALGLPRLPERSDVEERRRVASRLEADLARRRALASQLAGISDELESVRLTIAALERERRHAGEAEAKWLSAWDAWKAEVGIAEDRAIERAAGFLDALADAQAASRELRSVDDEIADADRDGAAWDAAARAHLARENGQGLAETSGERLIELVAEAGRRDVERQASLRIARELEREIEERGRRIDGARVELERAVSDRARLLADAGIVDEGEIEERRARSARRQLLEQACAERSAAFAARVAREPAAGELLPELARSGPAQWAERAGELDVELAEIEQRLLTTAACHRDAERHCRAMEESSEIGKLELEWSGLVDEIRAAVRRWRVLAVAQGLVEESLDELRASSQPRVLAEASLAFDRVTAGRYRRVEQDESGRDLVVVEAESGRRKRVPDELSRGTAEQLYLCLRLGLVADFARRGFALPVVMDDVLVNFDPERARATAAALGEFARERQVLFFTCHPDVREMLERFGGARVVA